MRKLSFLCIILLLCANSFAQHNYDNQGVIYSHGNNAVTIGNASISGNYDSQQSILEILNSGGGFLSIGRTNNVLNKIFIGATQYGNSLSFDKNTKFSFFGGGDLMTLRGIGLDGGIVTIGTNETPSGYKLAIGGKVIAEEMKVQLQSAWPDYVFDKNYNLWTIQEVDTYIKEHGHLHNIPSATEVKNEGIQLGEMNAKLLQKIEELTLYIIQQQEEIKDLQKSVLELKQDREK
ncbi:hypothetical protein [Aquimarina rhabdastrellae]